MKSELVDALQQEYERLGRPLDNADLNPDSITEFVANHFESGGSAPYANPPRPPGLNEPEGEAIPEQEEVDGEIIPAFYTVGVDENNTWMMSAFGNDGGLIQNVMLPNLPEDLFYLVQFHEGTFHLLPPGQAPVPCLDLLTEPMQEEAPATPLPLPPGVAAAPTLLGGMRSHGGELKLYLSNVLQFIYTHNEMIY